MERTSHDDALRQRELHLQALFIAGLGGDERAYRAFLSDLSGHVRGFLRSRVARQPEAVEDLVQEVLLAVHNSRHTYQADQPLTAWAFAITRYKLMDFYRARARHEAHHDTLGNAAELLAAPQLEPAQASRDLNTLLAQLPDRQRLPIQHVKVEGLSVVETAQRTGLSEAAVKTGIYRGLRALAQRIRGNP